MLKCKNMKIKKFISEIIILIAILTLLIYSSDPLIKTDSYRYIEGSIIDPPFLTVIISTLLLLFGTLKSIIIVQTLLIGFSIIYFTRTISNLFNLDNFTKILVILIIFLPTIKFYNYLLTESFGYSFSLLFVSFVIKLIYNFNIKNIFWTSIFVILLILLRKQFVFLYPLLLLIYFGIFIINKSKKTFINLTTSFLFIFLISNSLIFLNKYMDPENSNKKNYQNMVGYGPFYFTYIDSVYISTKKDLQSFESENIKATLTKIFEEMNNQKKLLEYYDGRGHFSSSFAAIRDYSQSPLIKLANQENTTVHNLKKQISIKLIYINFEKYLYLLFKKFYDSTWIFVFVPFLMMIAALIAFMKFKSKFSLLILFISFFSLANHSVTYLFGRVQPR